MPIYSPPVTRQRARALLIAQQQQQQLIDRVEEEQRKPQPEQSRIRDHRRRPQQQQQQQSLQRSATTATAKERGAATKEGSESEKAFARKRGAGGESGRPRTRGASTLSHARGLAGVGGEEGGSRSRGTAETRPTTAGTLGNSGSRWCKKGVGRSTRARGAGCRIPDPVTVNPPGGGDDKTRAPAAGVSGEQNIEAVSLGVFVSPSSSFSAASSAPASSSLRRSPTTSPRTTASDTETQTGVGGEAGADEPSPQMSSSSSQQQQPLEEVNPSVLNAKVNSNSGSGDGVSRNGAGNAGGVVAGKEGVVEAGEGAGLANKLSASGNSSGSSAVVGDVRAEGGEGVADVDRADKGGESALLNVSSSATFGGIEDPDRLVGGGINNNGGGFAAPFHTNGSPEGGSGGSQLGAAAAAVTSAVAASMRPRGKSVSTEDSSTSVVSPVLKRNRRELKLSEEETAMAGAPQGPVYQVQVLQAGDFERSPHPDDEMKAVLAAAGGGGDWADLYSAVDSTRRLCIFHRSVVVQEGNLEGAVGLLVTAVGNLRSSMVRNALLGVKDMFRLLGQDMGKVDIRDMVTGTLQRFAGEKRFICQTAAQAMEAVARYGPVMKIQEAILPSIDDRNPEVSAKSAFFTEQCLAAVGVGSKAGAGLPADMEFQPVVAGLAKALGGKLVEGRTAGRRGLLRCRKAMGPGPFEMAVTESLGKAGATSLLATIAAPNRDTTVKGGGFPRGVGASRGGGRGRGKGLAAAGKPSIREQMMAAKRKKEQESQAAKEKGGGRTSGGGGGGGGAGFLVVT